MISHCNDYQQRYLRQNAGIFAIHFDPQQPDRTSLLPHTLPSEIWLTIMNRQRSKLLTCSLDVINRNNYRAFSELYRMFAKKIVEQSTAVWYFYDNDNTHFVR
jgi:hypothetical protein